MIRTTIATCLPTKHFCRWLRHVLSSLIALWPISALGLSIGNQGLVMPFDVNLTSSQMSTSVVLQAVNDDAFSDPVLSWQMNLKLMPVLSAQGSLAFTNVVAPQDSLFDPVPGPLLLEQLPSSEIHSFDADLSGSFDGVAIVPAVARNVLQLDVSAAAGTEGDFQLVMADINLNNQDEGSSWFPSGAIEPVAFNNEAASSLTGNRLLGTFHVRNTIPGDYDGDGVVTINDFERWRAVFGDVETPAGTGADGNHDGIVDGADYVLWRQQFVLLGASDANLSVNKIPEPSVAVLATIGMSVSWMFLGRIRCIT